MTEQIGAVQTTGPAVLLVAQCYGCATLGSAGPEYVAEGDMVAFASLVVLPHADGQTTEDMLIRVYLCKQCAHGG